MVDVPDCRRPDGARSAPMFTQFNAAFEVGGSACTIRTVEKLTDIRVDHHVVVDFEGFKEMVDAVDGVEVCLSAPIDDEDAHLHLPAGRVTLDGEQALGYVRARKSLGDGSDTGRIERQQRFLGALVNKVRSNEILLNPVKLYPVLDAATSSLTTDPELASLRGLYELVRGLRGVPAEGVQFLTVPRESYAGDVNRDQLAQPAAGELFERLRKDQPVRVNTHGERKATERKQRPRRTARPRRPRSPVTPPPRTPARKGTSKAAHSLRTPVHGNGRIAPVKAWNSSPASPAADPAR